MIRIEVESTKVNVKAGTSKRTGNAYRMGEQAALLFRTGERYPDKIKITLDDPDQPYAVGAYVLDDASFVVDSFGGIGVRPRLVPAPAKAVA